MTAETINLTEAQARALSFAERHGVISLLTPSDMQERLSQAGLVDWDGALTDAGRSALAKHREAQNAR